MSLNERVNLTEIVAMDKNRVIGRNGDLPWAGRLRSDMDHFKRTTEGHTVGLGRKTYDSIPEKFRPLLKRENVVITRDLEFKAPGCVVIHDPNVLIRMSIEKEIFIIGGAEIYKIFLPLTERLIVTHVETEITDGDTFFPELNRSEWRQKLLFRQEADAKNAFSFSVLEYIRIIEM
ncbi:dihydrofolate reductase [Patescibacteria group bacterium]|nr:dihydrofolate reductase [Patescibacteria group bacterium]